MDFLQKLYALAAKVKQQAATIKTEEATKNAFILPFISNVLGYDIFDPNEVVPEYICDIGTKKGEKIDYAIVKGGDVQILIECKKIGEPLTINGASQLFRYFHVEKARISILTNGQVYKFFTDLDAPNKMDEKPFLEMDLLSIDENNVGELRKLTKEYFDVNSIINAAGELKYIGELKKAIANQFLHPEEAIVRFMTGKVYEGAFTQKVKEQFTILTKKALFQYLNDQVNDRIKSALKSGERAEIDNPAVDSMSETAVVEVDDVVTTQEEMEGYHIIRAIARSSIDVKRIVSRDTKSYFGILVDDNNRKPLCRLHFNRSKKYIGLFDGEKNEVRYEISSLDEIYNYADQITLTAKSYT